MRSRDDEKKKLMCEIETNDFIKLNGAIVRTLGHSMPLGWNKASDLFVVFTNEDETDIYTSLDYLQECGAIRARDLDTKQLVEICDVELDEIQIRLTDVGIQLLRWVKKDELISV